jgi:hypothetical protein
MSNRSDLYTVLCCFIGMSFIIWIGLFFGLVDPEINNKDTYIKTTCKIVNLDMINSYVCHIDFVSCRGKVGYQTCDYLLNHYSVLDPQQCKNNNTEQCVPDVALCDYGLAHNSNGGSTCYHNQHTTGVVICDNIDHIVNIVRQFKGNGNKLINVSITTNFNGDLHKAESYINKFAIGQETDCWYDPDNNINVSFNINFTQWKMGIMGFFAAVCIFLCILFILLIMRDRYDNGSFHNSY